MANLLQWCTVYFSKVAQLVFPLALFGGFCRINCCTMSAFHENKGNYGILNAHCGVFFFNPVNSFSLTCMQRNFYMSKVESPGCCKGFLWFMLCSEPDLWGFSVTPCNYTWYSSGGHVSPGKMGKVAFRDAHLPLLIFLWNTSEKPLESP